MDDASGESGQQATDLDNDPTSATSPEERLPPQLEESFSLSEDERSKDEVDFSSQGLTMAPSSLFAKTHITVLNLSSNNIRGLPAEVQGLVNLRRLDLSRNGLRCAHPKDFTSLPKEMETMTTLKELLLSECSLMYIPPAVWSIASLERLDISRNKVSLIPSDIMKLERLVHLNATQTGIKTLPEEIVCCDSLECLLLFGNPIESLPDTLRELTRLHTLHINYRLFATTVDSETEGMLQRQQLTSEHIPSVVFHIPRLREMDLESCKVNMLPRTLTRSLVEFNIAGNYFPTFPEAVCSLRNLTVLDVSRNAFKSLPSALKDLGSLRVLLARHNQLTFVDVVVELRQLERLDLGHNSIVRLPDNIGQLEHLSVLLLASNRLETVPAALCGLSQLRTLDLTGNRLASIPSEMSNMIGLDNAHQFSGLFKRGLWLHKNPIEKPPPKVWNTWDPAKIWSHMQRMEIQNVPKLRPCKLVLLGNHGCGKTSLGRVLRLGRPSPTRSDGSEYTRGFELSSWRSENRCPFVLLEVAGHQIFSPLAPKLLDPRALHCVVFDLEDYKRSGFEVAARWLRLLAIYVPDARVQLVGTKLDLALAQVKEAEIGDEIEDDEAETEDRLLERLREDLTRCLESLEAEDREWRQSQNAPDAPVVQLRLQPDIRLVAGVESPPSMSAGLVALRDDLEQLSASRELMPHLQKYVPTNWSAFMELVKRQDGLYLPWDWLTDLGEERNIRDSQLADCVEYYAECGQVIWVRRHPQLSGFVFHRPERLRDYLGRLLPTQLEQFLGDYQSNALFRSCGKLSPDEFDEAREAALTRGQLSWPMIRCLAFGRGGDRQALTEALHCLEYLGLACCNMPPKVPQPGLHSRPVLTVPYLARGGFNCEQVEPEAEAEAEAEWRQATAGCPHRAGGRLRCPPGGGQAEAAGALYPDLSVVLHSLVTWRCDWPGRLLCQLDHCHISAIEVDTDERDLSSGVDFQLASQSEVKLQSALSWLAGYADGLRKFAPGLHCRFEVL